MFKAMDVTSFKKFVKKNDCYIVLSTDHLNYIYDSNNKLVSTFAITHTKGSKKFVKPIYVKDFIDNLK